MFWSNDLFKTSKKTKMKIYISHPQALEGISQATKDGVSRKGPRLWCRISGATWTTTTRIRPPMQQLGWRVFVRENSTTKSG